jgi:hypothetical protein
LVGYEKKCEKIVEPCAPGVALNVRNAIYLGVRNWNLAQNSQKHTDLPQPALSYDTRQIAIHHNSSEHDDGTMPPSLRRPAKKK